MTNTKNKVLSFGICALCLFWYLCFGICHYSAAQEGDLEFTLDAASDTIPLPRIFKPNIDLSGRGFHRQVSWPKTLSINEALDIWQKDIGFSGLYRMQYDLWEIAQLSGDKESQNKLLNNYEKIIKNITEAGGTVILDLFGTPARYGKVLDNKSPPRDLKSFKELVKAVIRDLSCNKRYNVWYEVWSAPDLDDFFLGTKQEYLNLYRAVAESVNELKIETKIHIPLGGPSASWWFQNLNGNTIVTPEKSLIYELIKFCAHYHLPLDFISWHGYSTDPEAEKENTIYKKSAITLIRDWLTYFNFDRNIPLIVDEWNFDSNANVLTAREEASFITASYIPSRMQNMYKAGVDYQLYFCLEDFKSDKEGVVRNVGIFSYDPKQPEYKGSFKSIYNIFRMLANFGPDMFLTKLDDKFIGIVCTKDEERVIALVYNYIDPDIAINFLSKNIANLNASERKALLNIISSQKLEKILLHQLDTSVLRLTNKVNALLKKAVELNDKAKNYESISRNIKINIKNLKDTYIYQRYSVDSSCSLNCEFKPNEEKEVAGSNLYQESLTLSPYSAHMLIFKKKPVVPESASVQTSVEPAEQPQ